MDRSDVTVSFTNAVSDKTILELQRMPGVTLVEPIRVVPAVLRNGRHSYRGAIEGIPQNAYLYRAVDSDLSAIDLHAGGITLSTALADVLHVAPGDMLTVEVRTGRQPILQVPVMGWRKVCSARPPIWTKRR